jgi:hypothetical protein
MKRRDDSGVATDISLCCQLAMVKFVFSFFGHVPKQDFAPEKAELFWAKNILLQL